MWSVQRVIDGLKEYDFTWEVDRDCSFTFHGGRIEFDSWADAKEFLEKLYELSEYYEY